MCPERACNTNTKIITMTELVKNKKMSQDFTLKKKALFTPDYFVCDKYKRLVGQMYYIVNNVIFIKLRY